MRKLDFVQKSIALLFFVLSLVILVKAPSALANNEQRRFQNLQTTRLNATGGTGVAAILLEEASVLNPASLGFYKLSAFYLQRDSSDSLLSDEAKGLGDASITSSLERKQKTTGIVAADTKGRVKGALSYFNQENGREERKRFALTSAINAGPQSTLGFTYSHTRETIVNSLGSEVKNKYNQVSFGLLHVINKFFSLGLVVNDPLQERPQETRAIMGTQLSYAGFFILMADIGANYTENLADSLLYKGSIQLKIFDDFYLRFGAFNDQGLKEKGNGVGLSWVGPKLSLDFAFRNIERTLLSANNNEYIENDKGTSFALSYRF